MRPALSIVCATVSPMTLTALPDLNSLDSDQLKALVIQQHTLVIEHHALVLEKNTELESKQNEIESLKLLIAKLQRMQFGVSSEKLARHITVVPFRHSGEILTHQHSERYRYLPETEGENSE